MCIDEGGFYTLIYHSYIIVKYSLPNMLTFSRGKLKLIRHIALKCLCVRLCADQKAISYLA